MVTKYIVYVTETNSHNSKIYYTFDVEFGSVDNVNKYLCSLKVPNKYYCGHVSKLTTNSVNNDYIEEIIMHFWFGYYMIKLFAGICLVVLLIITFVVSDKFD